MASTRSRRRTIAFGFLLLLSGFCGISYEILYARVLSNLIGDQFAVSAAVLITFLAGIGFGSLVAHRLWRWLWLIEAATGACGVVFALGAARFGPSLSSLVVLHGGLGESLLVCVLVLCLPTLLIGAGLPLFGAYLEQLGSERAFHKAYGVYNIGAGLTVLLAEFCLLRLLGIQATILTMAAINGVTAIVLAIGFADLRRDRIAVRSGGPSDLDGPAQSESRFERRELAALALASVASAIFQLLMVKLAEFLLGPFRETFALVVALVLFGIAAGAFLVERLRLDFGRAQIAGLLGIVWLVGGFGLVARGYASLNEVWPAGHAAGVVLRFAVLAALMSVPAAAFGATIPALLRARGDLARDSGRLLFLSSIANVAGFLLMSFVLHQVLDYGVLALVVAGIVCLGVLCEARFRGRRALAAAALFVAALVLHRARWDEHLLYVDYGSFASAGELADTREKMSSVARFKGHQDVFSLVEIGDDLSFFINGYVSFELGSTTEPMEAALMASLSPRGDRALVLGLGSGMTAGATGLLFDRTDAVEINPAVVENLWRMKKWNFDIESMPNVRIIVDDGVHHVRTAKDRYTMILNTVTTPRYFSSAKLWTTDFYEAVRQRLTPDGLYVTWFDSQVGDRGLDIILRSLRTKFKYCWFVALRSSYFALVCSNEPIALRRPQIVAENPVLAPYFFEQSGIPAEWIPYTLIHPRAFDLIGDTEASLNTLDFPSLEFEVAGARGHGIEGFNRRLLASIRPDEIAEALGPGFDFDPMNQVLALEMIMGPCEVLDRFLHLAGSRDDGFERRRDAAMRQHLSGWALFGKTAAAHQSYAHFLRGEGRHQAAIEEYRKALAVEPRCLRCQLEMASSFIRLGDHAAASREYSAILKRYPTDADASFGLGTIALREKRYAEALPPLETAAVYYTRSALIRYCIGLAEEGLGRRDAARRSFGRALALDPEDRDIAAALARLDGAAAKTPR